MTDLSQRLESTLSDRHRVEHRLDRGSTATVCPEVASANGLEPSVSQIETVACPTHAHVRPLLGCRGVLRPPRSRKRSATRRAKTRPDE